jgi:predicted sugar kinase
MNISSTISELELHTGLNDAQGEIGTCAGVIGFTSDGRILVDDITAV